MDDSVSVECPYCGETVDLYVDPETDGELVQDCDVCCRPWRIVVQRDGLGALRVWVDRAQ